MPQRPAELRQTEKLKPLTAAPSGDMVRIDKGILAEVYERLAEAIGAVERGNNRTVGSNRLWDCVTAIWETGKPSADCPTPR